MNGIKVTTQPSGKSSSQGGEEESKDLRCVMDMCQLPPGSVHMDHNRCILIKRDVKDKLHSCVKSKFQQKPRCEEDVLQKRILCDLDIGVSSLEKAQNLQVNK